MLLWGKTEFFFKFQSCFLKFRFKIDLNYPESPILENILNYCLDIRDEQTYFILTSHYVPCAKTSCLYCF